MVVSAKDTWVTRPPKAVTQVNDLAAFLWQKVLFWNYYLYYSESGTETKYFCFH